MPHVLTHRAQRSRPRGREYDLVHIPPRNCFALPENDCIEGASTNAAPGTRGDLMPGLNEDELAELRKIFDSCEGDGYIGFKEFIVWWTG